MPIRERYETYLPNLYRSTNGVQISAITSKVYTQYVDIQVYYPLWLPLPTNPFTFKRIKYMNLFIIGSFESKLRKSSENSFSRAWLLVLESHIKERVLTLGSQVTHIRWVSGFGLGVPLFG